MSTAGPDDRPDGTDSTPGVGETFRVALACPYDWAAPGGVQAHVAGLAHTLATQGHDVTVVAPHEGLVPGTVTSAGGTPSTAVALHAVGGTTGVRFNRSVAPLALSPAAARRTRQALQAIAPDVVHVHEPLAPWVSLVAGGGARHPAVGTFHAWSRRSRGYRALAWPVRRMARGLEARVAVSPAARDHAATALGLPADAFEVVPNGVDVAPFRNAEPRADLADRERPLLLFVGRLEHRKGADVAVRAWLALRDRRPDVRLCVVGDGPERTRCARLVPGVARDDVRFVGRVPAEELPGYFASADAFVAPAIGGESFGIVLLEAMAAGVPVVASDIPGYRAVVAGEDTEPAGLLAPPQSVEPLADELQRLLADEALRRRLVAAGRRRADAHDWPHVAARLVALYAKVVG